MAQESAEEFLADRFSRSLGLSELHPPHRSGQASLESAYPVSELASAAVGAAAHAATDMIMRLGFPRPEATVHRELADAWFASAVRPIGWTPPPAWDPVAGDYESADGWIRLHTNAPHHRAAALRVLGVAADRDAVAAAVRTWAGEELEAAIVAGGGAAAMLRSPAEWALHPQGAAVAHERLVDLHRTDLARGSEHWHPTQDRPLAGLRVLDLTRVLAGPVATRLVAGLGADVLRVDPPDWEEPALEPDMTLGKRTTRLDARGDEGLARLRALLSTADVVVHGYRSDALDRLGLGDRARREERPGLVDVSLDAYGYTGPWATRRGFDSLVQMSTGIAGSGLAVGAADRPTPLPVQALDHATGYLTAAAVFAGLAHRLIDGRGTRARLSLARTAAELETARQHTRLPVAPDPVLPAGARISTSWGPAAVLPAPFTLDGVPLAWSRPPRPLGNDPAKW